MADLFPVDGKAIRRNGKGRNSETYDYLDGDGTILRGPALVLTLAKLRSRRRVVVAVVNHPVRDWYLLATSTPAVARHLELHPELLPRMKFAEVERDHDEEDNLYD